MASSSLTCVKEGNNCINSSIAIVRPFSCENHGTDAVGVMEIQDGISPSWRGVQWEPRGNMTVQIARLNLHRWLTKDLGDWSRYTFRTLHITAQPWYITRYLRSWNDLPRNSKGGCGIHMYVDGRLA